MPILHEMQMVTDYIRVQNFYTVLKLPTKFILTLRGKVGKCTEQSNKLG